MNPRDFVYSVHPYLKLSETGKQMLAAMVEVADRVAVALWSALEVLLHKGQARDSEREVFYRETEPTFLNLIQQMVDDGDAKVGADWMKTLRVQALKQFDRHALPGMDQRTAQDIQAIVGARKSLGLTLSGSGTIGAEVFSALNLPAPASTKKQGKAA